MHACLKWYIVQLVLTQTCTHVNSYSKNSSDGICENNDDLNELFIEV